MAGASQVTVAMFNADANEYGADKQWCLLNPIYIELSDDETGEKSGARGYRSTRGRRIELVNPCVHITDALHNLSSYACKQITAECLAYLIYICKV